MTLIVELDRFDLAVPFRRREAVLQPCASLRFNLTLSVAFLLCSSELSLSGSACLHIIYRFVYDLRAHVHGWLAFLCVVTPGVVAVAPRDEDVLNRTDKGTVTLLRWTVSPFSLSRLRGMATWEVAR